MIEESPLHDIAAELPLQSIELRTWRAAQRREERLGHDPARRRAHGIVHTPPELARGVVRVIDELLRCRYGLQDGIADERLHFVDPACGPGAFFAALLALAEARGAKRPLRMTGFDVDPEALALASELRAHPCARACGPGAPQALELIQADLLDPPPLLQLVESARQLGGVESHGGAAALRDGASRAGARMLVLLGNPPWASARAEPSPGSQLLLEDFRRDGAGERLAERKLGVLADAYVRFFRICAEASRRAPGGAVMALVTNASYLDGPVHRGMRAALLRWFDALYVLDLGGSALLGRAPGDRDDNVFGVRPSVAISWLCRDAAPGSGARLLYARLIGDRELKLATVRRAGLDALGFKQVEPSQPAWRFVPTRQPGRGYAVRFVSLAQCLPFQREGVQTNRDAMVVDVDRERLLERLRLFASGDGDGPELEVARRELSHYSPRIAQQRVAEALERDPDGALGISVQRLAYRPFDARWFCPIAPLCHRPRLELLAALAHAPAMLVSVRKDRGSAPWTHFAASGSIVDNCFLSARSSCRARAFPCRDPEGSDNLSAGLRQSLEDRLGRALSAAQFIDYALAILSAPSYRSAFDEELHQDYPRIPLPPTAASLQRLSQLGARIAQLFLQPLGENLESCAVGPLPAGLRYRDLELDPDSGRLRAGRDLLVELPAPGLALRVGHHKPLAGFIAARRDAALDPASLAAIVDIAQRLARLASALEDADALVRAELPELG